jgi:hypothetical protein
MRSTYLCRRKKLAPRAGKASICPQRLRCRPHRISRALSRSRAETNAFPATQNPANDSRRKRMTRHPGYAASQRRPAFLALQIHRQMASMVCCQVRSGLRAGGKGIRTLSVPGPRSKTGDPGAGSRPFPYGRFPSAGPWSSERKLTLRLAAELDTLMSNFQ